MTHFRYRLESPTWARPARVFAVLAGATAGIALVLGMTGTAAAQSSSGATSAPVETTPLTEIVVTAQKREEDVLKVPISVTAISADQLQRESVTTFSDLADQVPGLSLQDSGGGGVRPVIRGVSSFAGTPTVAIYVDDAAIQSQFGYEGTASGGSPEVTLLDVDHVEVLRGPQGTLYGGGSMGGAIKYVMSKPPLEGYDATVRAEGSYLDAGSAGGEVAFKTGFAAIDDVLGVSFSGLYRHGGGYIDQYNLGTRSVTDKNDNYTDTESGRLAVRADPTSNLSIVAAVLFQRRTYGAYDTFDSALGYPNMDNILPENGSDTFTVPTLTVTDKIGPVELVSATAYFDRDRQGREDYSVALPNELPFLAPFVPILNRSDESTRNFNQELRLRYDAESGRAGLLFGGYYFKSRLSEYQTTTGLPTQSYTFFDQVSVIRDTESAAFGEGYWRPIQPLKLTLGFRKSFLSATLNQLPGEGPFVNPPTTGKRTDQPFTPKINLSYDLSPNSLLYVQAAEGFRTGEAAGPILSICDPELIARGLSTTPGFGSDELWTYEAGAKGLTLDRTLEIWERAPESIFLASCGTTLTANIGDVTINGAEFESTYHVTSAFSISPNFGFSDAKYTNTSVTSGFYSGNPVPYVPRWTANVNGQYRFTAFALPSYLLLDYVYRDSMPQGSLIQADRSTESAFTSAYSLVNARLGASIAQCDVSLFLTNIGNRHPDVTAYFWHPGTLDADRITTIAPRTVGITLVRKF
jgi:outer membrane receptor protein involved in Fe transport